MIEKVENKRQLKEFIYFIKSLYKDDKLFVYPIFSALKRELTQKVLIEKSYTALLYMEKDKVLGRILYTFDKSKKEKKEVCYFSFFDFVNDQKVASELLSNVEKAAKDKGITHVEGTYTPYDPDTRRGILVQGFDIRQTIFTSRNFEYYGEIIEKCGYMKAYDTYTVTTPLNDKNFRFAERIARIADRQLSTRVDSLSYKNIDRDIDDVYSILQQATSDIIYQDAPTKEMIQSVFKNLKFFINKELVKIVREKDTNRAIAFSVTLPDFNEALRKSKGKISLAFLTTKITGARGMLQYVIPEYQNSGVIGQIIYETYKTVRKLKMNYFEGGTIMEENKKSWNVYVKFGGYISKIYRIYKKEV